MTSRLNNPYQSLTQKNINTHIFTEFSEMNKETTQKEVLQAIKDINISAEIGSITVESSDTITHTKLDTLNNTVTNKHLNSLTDSVNIGADYIELTVVSDISGKNAIVNASNVFAYNSTSGSVETITFSNSSYVETEAVKNRLDTTAILVDSVNNENKIRIAPTNSTIDSTYNGIISDSILFGTKTDGDIVAIEITDNKEIKVSADITNSSLAVTGTFYPETQPVSGTVAISNDIIVVDPINNSINDAPFDLIINGSTLWADSTPIGTPFFADSNGREGWYYDNFNNIANISNIYWYANPVSGSFQENDMTFSQLSCMYCIITPDYVENGSLTIPFMGLYSQPTGTNDFIPSFAHSRWVYQLNATNLAKLRKGESIILYTGTTRPEIYLNMPAYPLVLVSQNGDALSNEIIAYMTVNTQATTSKIGYLLQYVGYLNSAIGFNREYRFKNSKDRVIQNNQYSGSVSINNFPESQTINGSVSITGTPTVTVGNSSLAVTGDFYQATQPISGNVGITGTPTVTVGNSSLAVTGDFYPATQPVSGNVGITGTPTVTVGNSSLAVTGDFYPATQPISGNVGITGTPTVTVGNSSLAVTGSFYPATQPISGSVNANITNASINVDTGLDLSGLATESTLGSIKQKTDDFTFAIVGSETCLNTNIKTSINIGSMPNTSAGNDSIEIYGMDGSSVIRSIKCDTAGHLDIIGSVNANITNTSIPVTGSVDANITNTSLDTHMYGSSNGTTWHHLKTDANGILNTHSMMQDGAGNDLTSTAISAVRALDVNIAGGSISSVNIKSTTGNNITSVTTAGTVNGAVLSSLVGQTNNTIIGDTNSIYSGSTTKNGLNTFIINSTTEPVLVGGNDGTTNRVLKTSSTGVLSTTLDTSGNTVKLDTSNNTIKFDTSSTNNTVKLDTSNNTIKFDTTSSNNTIKFDTSSTNNTIKIDSSNNSIKITDGSDTADVELMNGNLTSKKALNTNSQIYGVDSTNSYNVPVQVTQTLYNSKYGLNMYVIPSNRRTFSMSGYTTTNSVCQIIGGHNGTLTLQTLTSSAVPWYWNLVSTVTAQAYTFTYDYVSTTGVYVEAATQTINPTTTNTYQAVLGGANISGILKWSVSPAFPIANTYTLNICNAASNNNSLGGGNYAANAVHTKDTDLMSVFVVPVGYIAYITNISLIGGVSGNISFGVIRDLFSNGGTTSPRKKVSNFFYVNGGNLSVSAGAAGSSGAGLGGIFLSGDRIFMIGAEATGGAARWCSFDIVMEAI